MHMTKQNAPTTIELWQNKRSQESKPLSPTEIAARQQYWDKYKTLSTTIWTESQKHSPRTTEELLQESQDLHLLKTWLMAREELNMVEYRNDMPLPERVWRLVCEEADFIAEMQYVQTKGLGMNLIDN
jgi:hypothetical protein